MPHERGFLGALRANELAQGQSVRAGRRRRRGVPFLLTCLLSLGAVYASAVMLVGRRTPAKKYSRSLRFQRRLGVARASKGLPRRQVRHDSGDELRQGSPHAGSGSQEMKETSGMRTRPRLIVPRAVRTEDNAQILFFLVEPEIVNQQARQPSTRRERLKGFSNKRHRPIRTICLTENRCALGDQTSQLLRRSRDKHAADPLDGMTSQQSRSKSASPSAESRTPVATMPDAITEPLGKVHARQPCASRTAIIAARMLFHVCGFIIVSLGNMQPSQQMWRICFVTFPCPSRIQKPAW